MSVAWMNNHSGLLVEHQHVIILMYNVQRNILRKDLEAATLIRHHELHDITRTNYVVRLYDLVVYTDVFRLDGKLDTMARGIFHMRRKIFVHTHRDLSGRNVKAVMLEHLLLLILIGNLITSLG